MMLNVHNAVLLFLSDMFIVQMRNEGEVKVLLLDVLVAQVRNEGEVKVPNAILTVRWPHALKDMSTGDSGKHVLYLVHEPVLVSMVRLHSESPSEAHETEMYTVVLELYASMQFG